MADALGRPLRLVLSAGQCAEIHSAAELLEGVSAGALIADRGAYDSDALRAALAAAGMAAVIPAKRNRRVAIAHDAPLYKEGAQSDRTLL